MRYDLLVIGNSPAALQAALAASALKQRVAIAHAPEADHHGTDLVGHATLPYETLEETVRDLPELFRQREQGQPRSRATVNLANLRRQLSHVVAADRDVVQRQLRQRRIPTFLGEVGFRGPQQVTVKQLDGTLCEIEAERIVVACGARPIRPAAMAFDGHSIIDANELLRLERLPSAALIVGAGVTGLRCAILMSEWGTRVTVVDGRTDLGERFASEELQRLLARAHEMKIPFRLGEDVIAIERRGAAGVSLRLEGGQTLHGEFALVAVGNTAQTSGLNLDDIGVRTDERGRVWCDRNQQSWLPQIYAAGEAVGFPAAARVSADSGVRAVRNAIASGDLAILAPHRNQHTVDARRGALQSVGA